MKARALQLVTLRDVAHHAGVSLATASRVLTSDPRVSADSRRAVERAAHKLGYIPNQAARALATGRSNTVALVVGEPTNLLFGDPFFPRLVRGIGEVLTERDMQLVLLAPQSESELGRLERYVAAGHADGVFVTSLHDDAHPLPRRLADRGIPVVVGGRPAEPDAFSHVEVQNVRGAATAVSHLTAGGRRVIATIGGPLDMPVGQDRLLGYRSALEAAGLPPDAALEEPAPFTLTGGEHAMRALLERRPDLDAVFAASDLQAAGALRVLAERGRRVPKDVAVVGYGDDPLAAATTPPLTSVGQPVEEMGREMARLLLQQIDSPSLAPRSVLMSTQLVVRRSSGAREG